MPFTRSTAEVMVGFVSHVSLQSYSTRKLPLLFFNLMGTSSAATVGAVVSTTVMTTGSGSESSSPSLTTRVTTYVPYRNAHSIVEHVGRRHHSSPYPVRAGPVLVRRNIGMPPSDLLTAGPAPAYLHPVPRHLGSGNRRNVGCVDNPHSLMLESASTSVAGVLSHRHLYNRLGDFIGRRRLSVAERPHTRLAAGTLGSAASPTLGERSRLALSCSLELGELLVQLFLGRRQLRNLPLQLRDQPHQFVALRGREVFGLTHSQSIKTCSVPHNPPTDADPANQLPHYLRPP